jgi:proline iminopeptidase
MRPAPHLLGRLRQSNRHARSLSPWRSRLRLYIRPAALLRPEPLQRGAFRSTRLGPQPAVGKRSRCRSQRANTTPHLIADIEALREPRGVDRWTILGLLWGCTLALAYAQTYPNRVNALVLASVTTTSHREVQWITEDIGRVFPQQWDSSINAIPEQLRHLRPVEAYARMLADPDPIVRDRAAREWCAWEDAHVSLSPGHTPNPRYQDPEFRLRFARLVTHYWRHAAFLEEDQLIRDAAKLNGVPGVLIHGSFDISLSLITAWRLPQRWTTCRLHVLDDAGHVAGSTFVPALINGPDIIDQYQARGQLRRSHPEGRKAGRSAGRATDQI